MCFPEISGQERERESLPEINVSSFFLHPFLPSVVEKENVRRRTVATYPCASSTLSRVYRAKNDPTSHLAVECMQLTHPPCETPNKHPVARFTLVAQKWSSAMFFFCPVYGEQTPDGVPPSRHCRRGYAREDFIPLQVGVVTTNYQ